MTKKTYILLAIAFVGNITMKECGWDQDLVNGLTAFFIGLAIIVYRLWEIARQVERRWRMVIDNILPGIYLILAGVLLYYFEAFPFWLILGLAIVLTVLFISVGWALRRTPADRTSTE